MVTGGGLTKDGPKSSESQFSPDELAALVDEAHNAGVPVAAHAHGTDGIAAAMDAGVDTIEHCPWRTSTGLDLRQDVLEQIIDRSITVCPAVSPHRRQHHRDRYRVLSARRHQVPGRRAGRCHELTRVDFEAMAGEGGPKYPSLEALVRDTGYDGTLAGTCLPDDFGAGMRG
ncbi:amidohydrolase family protein [Streptomyces iconiensis]|uniref:Amidohydrolase family protein n=1 Tax=Streptomyces iconiensis TaxID=1384038 RepID=A0ABT6ZNG0_9ACTN|nr:amidohydrolase family protein [Streptomyces iconiensis]MDJ1130591.1 amidohydrolase family protein [Streptomyces iconiensis]